MSEVKSPGAAGSYGGHNEGGEARDHQPVTSAVPERKEKQINPSAPGETGTTERDGAERSTEHST